MLKVLGRAPSINVRKVLWTCAELGLGIEHEADWGTPARPLGVPEFLALNPNAQVPVIVDDGFVMWESNAICRYLADRHGRADLLPADPRERARVEQWMDWQATELNAAWRPAFMARVRGDAAAVADPRAVEASVERWNRLMALLDAQLARGGPHVTGAAFTLADVVLALATNRWRRTPMEHVAVPAVDAWFERLRARPAFLAFCDNGQP
jgi:glutathione S-transferase